MRDASLVFGRTKQQQIIIVFKLHFSLQNEKREKNVAGGFSLSYHVVTHNFHSQCLRSRRNHFRLIIVRHMEKFSRNGKRHINSIRMRNWNYGVSNWKLKLNREDSNNKTNKKCRTRFCRFLFTNELQLQIITVWPPLSSSPSTGGSLSNRVRRFTEKKSSHDQQPYNSSSCTKQQMLHRSRYRSGLLCMPRTIISTELICICIIIFVW